MTEEMLRDHIELTVQSLENHVAGLEIPDAAQRARMWAKIAWVACQHQQSAESKAAGWTK